jgi:hypothetical protein
VHPDKVLPLEEEVPLEEPALSMLAESMPAQDKLHQMEADSPAVIVIAYICIIAKLGNGEGLRIGMDPLRGVFWTLEGLV